MIGQVVSCGRCLIRIASNVLKVNLGNLQHFGLVDFQLRDVETYGHVGVFDTQLTLCEGPCKQEEH